MSGPRWSVPDSWAWATISALGKITGGGTPSARDGTNFADAGIPWVTPADLTGYQEAYISRGRRDLSPSGYASCGAQLMPAGTVLYSSRAPIGYCAIAANEIATNQGFKSVTPSNGVIPEYLRHYLLASKDYAESLASGTTFLELSGARFGEVFVPLPPIEEQRRIVAKLDALTARTACARADLDRIPALAAQYKQAILSAAFSGELTRDLRSETGGSGLGLREELLQKRKDRLRNAGAPTKDIDRTFDFDGENSLPALPPDWAWMPVQALATKVTDGVHKKPNYTAQGVPFLTVRNMTAGLGISFEGCRFVAEEDHAEYCKRTCPEFGDILISKDGTLGVVRAVRTRQRFSIFVSVALVKPVDPSMSDYLELAFQSPVVQGQMVGVGSGLQHIHLTDLRRDMIPVAPEIEQSAIVARVRSAFTEIDRLTAEAAAARRLLDRLDQAILAKAFRGELVPQDPTDEPAGVLLDRIRAERAAAPKARRALRREPA